MTNSKLRHNQHTEQVFRGTGDATRSLEFRGTSATLAESLGKSGPREWPYGSELRATGLAVAMEAVDELRPDPEPTALDLAERTEREREARWRAPLWTHDAEWAADLEYVWKVRVAPHAASLQARARKLRREERELGKLEQEYKRQDVLLPAMRVTLLRSAEWSEHRAQALTMTRADIVDSCGQRWRAVKCGCGTNEFRVLCDNPALCATCRKRHAAKWRKRITAGMDAALRTERAQWYRTPRYRRRGMLPGIYLLTLTGPHSGDLEQDRNRMGKAVRKLLKHAHKHGWWRTYALTWEATNGDDGLGHMHVHLACISSWIPYTSEQVEANDPEVWRPRRKGERRKAPRGLHEVWREALPGALVVDAKAPRKDADDSASAGFYLAKYVTKGVDPGELSGRKAGELLVAFRGKRKVSTSEAFFLDEDASCPCCGGRYESTGAPCSLQELKPGAVLRSMFERLASEVSRRREEQVGLRWTG